ncbi:hypothetical protein [Zavarzinella formosa]|uniref:hypothetical protein n=1 Tax=Zavarzinella formosa TaxID=360055 RepID=UPI0002EF1F91|nr:hypothetical protein [Zavarzinella formosa]
MIRREKKPASEYAKRTGCDEWHEWVDGAIPAIGLVRRAGAIEDGGKRSGRA